MQVETERDCTARYGAGELSAQRSFTVLGILLLVLSGFSAGAETNTKNVLIVLVFCVALYERKFLVSVAAPAELGLTYPPSPYRCAIVTIALGPQRAYRRRSTGRCCSRAGLSQAQHFD